LPNHLVAANRLRPEKDKQKDRRNSLRSCYSSFSGLRG
jgi:hypothetical protein